MNRIAGHTKKEQATLAAFLGIGVFAPILLHTNASMPWIPAWLGAATGLVALLGAFLVFWRAGALRIRFLVLLFIAVGVAAACAALLGHT
jgi:hypothetical protein